MEQNVEQLKQEISEQYLKNFKKELGWLKSIALLPIEKKVKNLISGKTELPQKFDEIQEFGRWKDIISFMSLNTANQIFEFMKQKRLEIQKRSTREELENLKNEVLGYTVAQPKKEEKAEQNPQENPESQDQTSSFSDQNAESSSTSENANPAEAAPQNADQEPNSMFIGASVGGLGAGGVYVLDKLNSSRELKKMAKNVDAENIKTTIENSIAAMQRQKEVLREVERLSTKQVETIDKHIQKLTEGLESVDGKTVDVIKLWNQLDGKLPKELLQSVALDPKTLSKLEKLAPELVGKSDDQIKALLKTHNIDNVPDELLQAFKKAGNVDEFKGMTKILAHGSKINRFLQTLAGSMVLDVAFLGLDIWMYFETKKEAELIAKVNEVRAANKNNQANVQLGIGIASVAVEAAIILTAMAGGTAVGGPFGMVAGLAVGAISAAASMGVDSLYFDVQNFYTQNQEDFLRQTRGELKFAILQGLHNQKQGNISLNEKVHSKLANLFSVEGKDGKAQSLKEACFSMLFLEEIQRGDFKGDQDLLTYVHSGEKKADFLAKLPEDARLEFEKKWEAISAKINLRLEYINAKLADQTVIQQIQGARGMQYLTELFTASKLYAYAGKEKWKSDLSGEENLKMMKSEFFADFPPEKLAQFEQLKTKNPTLFQEILVTVQLDQLNKENAPSNYLQNLELVNKYQEWLELTQSYEEQYHLQIPDTHKNMKFIERLLEADFDMEQVEYPSFDAEEAKNVIQDNQERRGMMEVSDDPMQNVLYQLAKQLYGYAGQNTQEELMQFFSANEGVHGFYYDNKRKLNEERAFDQSIDALELGEYSENEVPKLVDRFLNGELQSVSFGFSYISWLWNGLDKSVIDTATESIDEHLQAEWKASVKALLTKELKLRSKENKNKVKSQISEFVKKHSKDGEYLELPYYLLIQAREAGFGDLQRQFFAWKEGKMQILGMQTELGKSAGFDAERLYFTQAREQFTEQEQRYIDRVEQAHQKLEKLRNVTGKNFFGVEGNEDELDLPREVEMLISQKFKEREQFKSELLLRGAVAATDMQMIMRYEEFYQYFERLYDGILRQLTEFKVSNDFDSYALYQSAWYQGNQELFEKDGSLKTGESKLLQNAKIRTWYQSQLLIFKIGEKTIQELWKSEKKEERDMAKRASELMLRMLLEKGLLMQNENGEIEHIRSGEPLFLQNAQNGTMRSSLDESFNQQVQAELAKLQTEPALSDAQAEVNQLLKPIEIKALQTEEKDTIDYAKILQEQIENTQKEIVWQGKRGNLSYLPEQSALRSWGNQVAFEKQGEKYFLKGGKEKLEVGLTLQELCWLANFRNRYVYKYKGKKISLEREILSRTMAFSPTFVVDGTVLLDRTTLNKHCPICKDDQAIEKIKNWLNNQL